VFKVQSDPTYVVGTRYQIVDERVVATGMIYSDAYTVAALLNQQAESKTPPPAPAQVQTEVNRKLDESSGIFQCSPGNPCIFCRGWKP
jgi:hypothetical protein